MPRIRRVSNNVGVSRHVSDPDNNTDLTFEEKILCFVDNDREIVRHAALNSLNACTDACLYIFACSTGFTDDISHATRVLKNSSNSSTVSSPMLTVLSCIVVTFIKLA